MPLKDSSVASSCLNLQSRDCRLYDFDVLLDGPGAGSNCSNNVSAGPDRNSAAENDDLTGIALLDPVEWLPWLREPCHIRGRLVEEPRCYRLVDGEVDAADEPAILANEGHQVAPSIDHRDVVSDSEARGLRLRGGQHSLCILEGNGVVLSWHGIISSVAAH